MTIMTRGGAETWWGETLPKETAYLVKYMRDREFRHVTYQEIAEKKHRKQKRQLARKRISEKAQIKPCYIWTFYNKGFPYGGWWLYVKTHKEDYPLDFTRPRKDLMIKAMQMFPCGLLPIKENFRRWKEEFAKQYHRPTEKRPNNQGMVLAWAKIRRGKLLDLYRTKEEVRDE